MQIHWFPGHMNKALNEIAEKIKIVDVVIEVLDIRIPFSSINEEFEKFTQNKKHLYVFTKSDLADPEQTKLWKEKFIKEGKDFVVVDLLHSDVNKIINNKILFLAKEKHQKDIVRGMKPQPVKAMILGIPNVGKSSLINKLAKRKVAGVENRPGFTRGEQFIKVNNDFLLVDTPGILPMNYEDKNKAIKLALVGSIKEDILPIYDLTHKLFEILKEKYPNSLKNRYGIENIENIEELIKIIGQKRGFLSSNGIVDLEKTCHMIHKEFRDGLIGKFTLDWCE